MDKALMLTSLSSVVRGMSEIIFHRQLYLARQLPLSVPGPLRFGASTPDFVAFGLLLW